MYKWYASEGKWRLCNYPDWIGPDGLIHVEIEPGTYVLYVAGGDLYESELYRDVPLELPLGPGAHLAPDVVSGFAPLSSGKRVVVQRGVQTNVGAIGLKTKPLPYGAVAGMVTEEFSGKGTSSVEIVAFRFDEPSGTWVQSGCTYPYPTGVVTFAGTKERPLTGKIRLRFHTIDWDGETVWYPREPSLDTAHTLSLRPGEVVYGVDHVISRKNQLRGSVLYASTLQPETRACMRCLDSEGAGDEGSMERTGHYLFGPLPAGTYTLQALDTGLGFSGVYYGQSRTLTSAARVTLTTTPRRNVDDLDIYLSDDPALCGKVTDPDGHPLPDILVRAFRQDGAGNWTGAGSTYTDSFGRYACLFSSRGTYTLSFTDTGGTAASNDDKIYYLGGATSLASAGRIGVGSMAALAPTIKITLQDSARAERIAGMDRYGTALAASQSAFPSGETTCALLATGESFPDALSAAGLSGAVDGPILLTKPRSLEPRLLKELVRLGVKKLYLLGGEAAISSRLERLLAALGYEVERLAGPDRYATSAAIAAELDRVDGVDAQTPVFVTSGASYADALAAGPAAFNTKAVVLLVGQRTVPAATRNVVRSLGLKMGYVVGGPAAVSDTSLQGLKQCGMLSGRCANGSNRYETAVRFASFGEQRGWLGASQVGLAVGTNFADALAAGPATARNGGLMLLAQPKALPVATANAIAARRARVSTIKVYGGSAAVASRVLIEAGSR